MIATLSLAERAWLIGVTVMAVSALLLGLCLLNAVMETDRGVPSPDRK